MITTKSTMQLYDIVESLSISPADIRKEFFVMLIKEFAGDVDLLEAVQYSNKFFDAISHDEEFLHNLWENNKDIINMWIEGDDDN